MDLYEKRDINLNIILKIAHFKRIEKHQVIIRILFKRIEKKVIN